LHEAICPAHLGVQFDPADCTLKLIRNYQRAKETITDRVRARCHLRKGLKKAALGGPDDLQLDSNVIGM
jgi:hypothetical protein